jgi:hypothetical protein
MGSGTKAADEGAVVRAANTEFHGHIFGSVFSTLLFITQQSQNWEEGAGVLLDELRDFRESRFSFQKKIMYPKKVS